MNKKLLATAIGAALVTGPMWAQADVKVGGHAQVEYYSLETDTTGSTTAKANGLVDNARGRLWVTANEDLGGGMKALAHFEFSVDTANSGQADSNGNASTAIDGTTLRTFDQRTREKYVGLSGGFGTFLAGNLHGTYKRLGGVRWDPFNATILEARGNGGQSGTDVNATQVHNGFIPGALKWESGKLFGNAFSAELLYAPEKDSDRGGTAGDQGRGDDWHFGVSFKPMQGLEIVAATFNNQKTPNTTNLDQDGTKLGVRWSGGNHTVWYQWEEVDVNNSFTTTTASAAVTSAGITTATRGEAEFNWLGYSYKFGNNLFVVQVGDGDMTGSGAAKRDHSYANLGVIHSFSKNTSAWVGWRNTEREISSTTTDTDVWAVGMRVNF